MVNGHHSLERRSLVLSDLVHRFPSEKKTEIRLIGFKRNLLNWTTYKRTKIEPENIEGRSWKFTHKNLTIHKGLL